MADERLIAHAPSEWCGKLCELLGLPPDRTAAFTVKCRVGAAVEIEAEIYGAEGSLEEFKPVAKRFILHEVTGDAIDVSRFGD